MNSTAEDLVVLLGPDAQPCGTADRVAVHTEQTPLHLAFSCYLVNGDNQILLTRRALTKRTWPGVWTNSCCGHPKPGEPMEQAIERRVREELGVDATSIRALLPDFRYEAIDASGIRENEVCPVFVATLEGALTPDPAEVMETRWVDAEVLATVAGHAPWMLSPWCVDQVAQMDADLLGRGLGLARL